jgi:CRISPR-associated protein Csd1
MPMSALESLACVYDHLAERGEAPPFGYSAEKIGFLISLNEDGTTAGPPIDLREGEGKKKTPPLIRVPLSTKRTSGVAPNFLWDKTSYLLGVTAGEGTRTAEEHAAFVSKHKELLQDSADDGLRALFRFLESWSPDNFASLDWPEEMKDQNVVHWNSRPPCCARAMGAALLRWREIASRLPRVG